MNETANVLEITEGILPLIHYRFTCPNAEGSLSSPDIRQVTCEICLTLAEARRTTYIYPGSMPELPRG